MPDTPTCECGGPIERVEQVAPASFRAWPCGHFLGREDLDAIDIDPSEDLPSVDPPIEPTQPIADAGGETILVCPECDSTHIKPRSGRGYYGGDPDERWYCHDCTTHFREAARRPRQNNSSRRSGLARELVEADPDDLVTDGGQPDLLSGGKVLDLPGARNSTERAVLDLQAEFDAILVGRRVAHLPDGDGDPVCRPGRGTTTDRLPLDHLTTTQTITVCSLCSKDGQHGPNISGAGEALQEMDVEEFDRLVGSEE